MPARTPGAPAAATTTAVADGHATLTEATSSPAGEPRLRPAVPADLGSIESLLTNSSLPLGGVVKALADFIVAEEGNEVVGVAGVEAYREGALLRSVAVASRCRSQGLGRALVSRVIRDTEARGIRDLYLLTTTAANYFPGFGFQPISREEVPATVRESVEFQGVCPASATVMSRQCATASA